MTAGMGSLGGIPSLSEFSGDLRGASQTELIPNGRVLAVFLVDLGRFFLGWGSFWAGFGFFLFGFWGLGRF